MTDATGHRALLPMISTPPGDGSDRVAAGWELRFVAEGTRAEEMTELYRELGFEVAADPVHDGLVGEATEDCDACRALAAGRFTAIYTRRIESTKKEGDG